MAKLSQLQLAALLEEIASAMRRDVSVADALRRLERSRLGRVGRVAGGIAKKLEQGQTISAALDGPALPNRSQMAACVNACEQTGDARLLDRLARLLRKQADYRRNIRLAWVYPVMLVVLAYAVLVLFTTRLVLDERTPDICWPDPVVHFSEWLSAFWVWPVLGFVTLVIVAALYFRSRVPFPKSVRLGLFCESLADQIALDVPDDVAIQNAAALSGANSFASISNPSMNSPEIVSMLSRVSMETIDVPEVAAKEVLVARLRYLATIHLEHARRQRYWWTHLVPRFAIVGFGTLFVFSYIVWVIGPVYRQVALW
ncbi:type II secretion system F family protein [Novipirellula maiorica]|uniref:type II secretion system F family protein n=1 Tax=Novipirellula maiorica TaxID=1265734 RepID=UPI00034BE8F2|nr:type II secretion system F family protein [Rhodopirellula maiorica]